MRETKYWGIGSFFLAVTVCALAVALVLPSCKKKKTETFNIVRKWRVERVTLKGEAQPNHQLWGAVYEFTGDGRCIRTLAGGNAPTEHTYVYSDGQRILQIEKYSYIVYKAEGDELVFAWVVNGADQGTYYLVAI